MKWYNCTNKAGMLLRLAFAPWSLPFPLPLPLHRRLGWFGRGSGWEGSEEVLHNIWQRRRRVDLYPLDKNALMSRGKAAFKNDSRLGHTELAGQELGQAGIGSSVDGGRRDADFELVVVEPDQLVLAGVGLDVEVQDEAGVPRRGTHGRRGCWRAHASWAGAEGPDEEAWARGTASCGWDQPPQHPSCSGGAAAQTMVPPVGAPQGRSASAAPCASNPRWGQSLPDVTCPEVASALETFRLFARSEEQITRAGIPPHSVTRGVTGMARF